MPRINIYEHSETYSFQTKNNSYATVAFPIAAIWGPTYVEGDEDSNPDWVHFSSGFRGTTDFMQTFRGANNYLGSREKSYDYALKLLAAGYDILVKRVDGLGNKSSNRLFVVPIGGTEPVPAYLSTLLVPDMSGTPSSVVYGNVPYRFYLPLPELEGGNIVWDYSYAGSDSLSMRYAVEHRAYDFERSKWVPVSTANAFKIKAKSVSASEMIVVIGKPEIITTQIKPTNTSITVQARTEKGKKVTVTGTIPVSVYTADGTILERRNITVTETSEYIGAEAQVSGHITVDSILSPEFTYIQIEEIPAILTLKAVYDNGVSNLFSSNSEDVSYGFFTFRLGTAWSPSTSAESASASATSSTITSASVVASTFGSQVYNRAGSYEFTYAGTTSTWSYQGSTVTLNTYGISIEGTASDGDKIVVTYTPASPDENLILNSSGVAAVVASDTQLVQFRAKFPGSFGNNLKVRIKCGLNGDGLKIGTVEVFDNNGYNTNPNEIVPTDQLLELVPVAFDDNAATDNRPLITEATFSNLDSPSFIVYGSGADVSPSEYPTGVQVISLLYGTDYANTLPDGEDITANDVKAIVAERFDTSSSFYDYISRIAADYTANDPDALIRLYNQQMLYKRFYDTVGELTDPIVYDWDALVMGIADDQYVPKSFLEANGDTSANPFYMEYEVSTLVTRMIEVAANSKCGAALIGTPFGMPRGIQVGTGASTVKTGALKYKDAVSQAVGPVYSTFGEVVGPWCKTTLALAGSNSWISPEMAHLLLIINAKGIGGQNKWWMVPAGMMGTGIVHSPEYKIKKHYLDLIQNHDEGVCLNPLMEVPGKGFTCFGNSTLWDKPLGTYNALQNLSTRFLTNRVKQRIWDTAIQILFRYNNEDAYSHFYAGLSPLLDEMRAVGALTGNEYNPWGYRIIMNPDIINLDRINANTVIGKVELAVTGVIDTVEVDLFLLPPTGFQETYD